MKYVILEHHPNDSRLKIAPNGICQTLSQRMGTGGGNVPLVLISKDEVNERNNNDDVCRILHGTLSTVERDRI